MQTTQGDPDAPEADNTTDALAAFGLCPDDQAVSAQAARHDKCYLWPCNVATFRLWQGLQTQWRVGGMGQRTGLCYASVTGYLRHVQRIKPKDITGLFATLQAMESAALAVWAESSNK